MKEKKNTFLDAAVILFFLTFVNKLLGFVKSMTIASIYGATIQTDAYYVAEGLMQNVLISISEALAVSFLPIYISIREKYKEDSKGFTSRTMTDVFILAIFVSVVLYISAPILFRVLFPAYTLEESQLAVSYFRIMVWGMCFYMSNQLLQSLLNAEKNYGFSSLAAMMNNVILTAIVLLFGHKFGLTAMAVAVPVSYVVQYIFLQIRSKKYGCVTLKYGLRDSRITRLCIQTLPIFWGNAFSELNQLVDKSLLSGMEEGTVTAVSYAGVLYQFASNMIGIPMTTIIYTELAESFAAGKIKEGMEKMEKGIHISLFFCIPITIFIIMTADLIVSIAFGRGAFGEYAVALTAQGLRCYVLYLTAFCVNTLLFRACYSLGDTAMPMKIGMGTVGLNIVLSITLSKYLGLSGVVLATAISNIATCFFALYIFNRKKQAINFCYFIVPIIKIGLATMIATGICEVWLQSKLVSNKILVFSIAVILEFGSFIILTIIGKEEIAMEGVRLVRDRWRKRD